ncbi:MAG TPA: DUF1634 domain-containing protein [Vicinamibacterales bacterium]
MTRLERSIGLVLRAGVVFSSTCLALGLLMSLTHVPPRTAEILLQTGILALLCTPVARVVISTVEYVIEREWRFATLTTIVLLELLASAVAALVFNRRL